LTGESGVAFYVDIANAAAARRLPMSLVTGVPSAVPIPSPRPVPPCPHPLLERAATVLLLLGLCAYLFFYGLNAGQLYRTESLRAVLGAETLRGGDWVVPTLHGEPLLTKPPGMGVAIALASWPAGAVTAATARLPSALAATLTVLLVYGTFARRLGRRGGLAAAGILPASVPWLERAPSAEIDMLQLAWVAGAVLCFLRALEAAEANRALPRSSRGVEWVWWQAALLCVAGGVLTKWTAPAFFYLTAVPLLGWRGRLRDLGRLPHLVSAALAAGLCLAWGGAVVARVGWDALYDTVRREALQHLSPLHHLRPYPWREVLTFPLQFLLANLPWSAFALLTLRPAFARPWDDRQRRLLQVLHCWTWPNLLFWSLVPGHHIRHAMPLQPGLAGLAALAWIAWLTGRLRWPLPRPRPGRLLLGMLLAWLAVKLVHAEVRVPRRDADRRPPRARGEEVARLVPPGETLYLFRLKDDGILFYYGRPARRLPSATHLPVTTGPRYCLLTWQEWLHWPDGRPAEVLYRLDDEQGGPLVLVKVAAVSGPNADPTDDRAD
jgi:4-amino-4-deoxy-L-arabinose transferase-like glycosyltransferase